MPNDREAYSLNTNKRDCVQPDYPSQTQRKLALT